MPPHDPAYTSPRHDELGQNRADSISRISTSVLGRTQDIKSREDCEPQQDWPQLNASSDHNQKQCYQSEWFDRTPARASGTIGLDGTAYCSGIHLVGVSILIITYHESSDSDSSSLMSIVRSSQSSLHPSLLPSAWNHQLSSQCPRDSAPRLSVHALIEIR